MITFLCLSFFYFILILPWSIDYSIPAHSGQPVSQTDTAGCGYRQLWGGPDIPLSCLPYNRVLITTVLNFESRQSGPFSNSFIFTCFITQTLHTLPCPGQKCFKGRKCTPSQEALNPPLLLRNNILRIRTAEGTQVWGMCVYPGPLNLNCLWDLKMGRYSKKDGWILKPSPQERNDQRNQYRNMSML